MTRLSASVAALALLATGVAAQTAPQWGQCGGQGWTGATTCPSGYFCQANGQYYSQCIPGTATATTTAAPGSTGGGSPTPTTTAGGAAPTLVTGYSFIRGVEAPHFHEYLQSETLEKAGDAVLGSYMSAALFQVASGQLTQRTAAGTTLYAQVEALTDTSVKKLKVSWAATPATSGAFVFSGDTLEWSNPTITRPQNNAWLICADAAGHNDVYVNLGPYSYQTPAGCADQTIHAYTGPVAVS